MPEVLDLKDAVENIIGSYESKIENIGSLFESAYQFLNEFEGPILEAKRIRDEIGAQLRELLSHNEHIRHKDFDRMMQAILSGQAEKENEIRNLLSEYFAEQKEMLKVLRDSLDKIKDNCSQAQIKDSQGALAQALSQQEKRKQEVSLKLKEFQGEQRSMTQRLLDLLAKGKGLRIRDLKEMFSEFDGLRRARLAAHQERKIETQKRKEAVRSMLGEFKRRRTEFPKIILSQAKGDKI